MKPQTTFGSKRRGQTLVMAMIILGVLLVLGVVFLAMIRTNIRQTVAHNERTMAYDLAESGVRYVHTQMLNSLQGADWRPTPTPLPIPTTDPDYEYLRPPNAADNTDHGGPDKQGPYTRLIFDRGRALVRVRYAPSDPTIFSSVAVGDLLQPGLVRNYTIIESVGKAGRLALNDPTTGSLLNGQAREITESKKVIGFVSCGLIEHALFIDNKFNVSRPAEIGYSNGGAMYGDNGNAATPVNVPVVLGASSLMFNPFNPNTGGPTPTVTAIPYGGGVYVNGDLLIHGTVVENVNSLLGDGMWVNGEVRGADDTSRLVFNVARPDFTTPGWTLSTTTLGNNTSPSLDSNSNNFSTILGVFKDAFPNGDKDGYPRGIPRKEPPSILTVDRDNGVNRYVQMTQLSGRLYATGNAGRNGHGQGVYVGNSADVQIPADEQGREDVGSAESLPYDWLNPNNGQANSGWQGAFYVPRGAVLRFYSDGFLVIRDGRAPANQRTWREPDGSLGKRPGAQMNSANPADVVDSPYCRFKLVPDPATGIVYVLNSYSALPNGTVIDINAVNSTNIAQYRDAGYPFNGVLYFAGNVRVRGEIPTDMQVTVVSGATIYIDGSITKGIVNNGTRSNIQLGRRLNTPSKSMLALLAKDYVAVNTTQFFGTAPQQTLDEVNENPGSVEWNPVRVHVGNAGGIGFLTEMLLNPDTPPASGGNPSNPSTWQPYITQYLPAGAVNGFEDTRLLLSQATDDGPAPLSAINVDVNPRVGTGFAGGSGEWQYLFSLTNPNNSVAPYFPAGYTQPGYTVTDAAPLYGLGGQPWQRYSKLESSAFPLVTSDFTFDPIGLTVNGSNTSPSGLYHLLVQNNNDFGIAARDTVNQTPTNDYIIARAAVVPHDIRIEATIFAEEGSFFVIPGPWFNPNPNDRRDTYLTLGGNQQERDLARMENFGSAPDMPFYGEPLDVRIQVFGAITENMPPPISQQAEWLKKWGWIPRYHGASGEFIPQQHVPAGYDVTNADMYVPNISVIYDPALATDRNNGFVGTAGPAVDLNTMIRYQGTDLDGNGTLDVYYALPPLPRLPVSPTLAYFGEVNP